MLNGTFEFYSFGDGRIIKTEDKYQYQYQLNDHLGNTVVMFEDKSGDNTVTNDEVIQRYYYYPFGAETKNAPWTQQPTPNIRYQYNGKEKIDELGLGWNDYGARNYDALLGRWMGVDALAEKYVGYSSYVYCLGNPIRFVDVKGMYVIDPQATKEEREIIQEGINYARELVKDDKVMAALIRYGYTTADQILSDLVDNQGPVLKITFTGDKRYTLDDEYAPYGETVMYQHTNELGIGKSYINRIKKSRKTSRKDYLV